MKISIFEKLVASDKISVPASKLWFQRQISSKPAQQPTLHLYPYNTLLATTGASFFKYDEWGYDFITTQKLCDVCRENVPDFTRDLSYEAFGKEPKDLFLTVVHPGGTRMVCEVGGALELEGSRSNTLATNCMADGGNIASVSVIDMIAKCWDKLGEGDQIVVVGMGPGFVMCGAALQAPLYGKDLMTADGVEMNA